MESLASVSPSSSTPGNESSEFLRAVEAAREDELVIDLHRFVRLYGLALMLRTTLRLTKPKLAPPGGFRRLYWRRRPPHRSPLETAQDRWKLALTGAQLARAVESRRA